MDEPTCLTQQEIFIPEKSSVKFTFHSETANTKMQKLSKISSL